MYVRYGLRGETLFVRVLGDRFVAPRCLLATKSGEAPCDRYQSNVKGPNSRRYSCLLRAKDSAPHMHEELSIDNHRFFQSHEKPCAYSQRALSKCHTG